MITQLKKDDVIAIGARHRASYLLEQYGYTAGVAKLDGEALTALLPEGYLEEVAACAERVSEAMKNKTLSAEESKNSTQNVNKVMAQAKEWRKEAVQRGKFADRSGHTVPALLTRLDNLRSVPAVAENMNNMIKLIEANRTSLPGGGLPAFINEGKALVEQIRSFDSAQEVKRWKSLPEDYRDFYHEKGLLYTGIKGINDWGRALHRGNPTGANAYNLNILRRHMGKSKSATETTGKA